MTGHIYHALEHTNGLVKDTLGVCDIVSDREGAALEVRLQQEVCFHMRVFKVILRHFQRH